MLSVEDSRAVRTRADLARFIGRLREHLSEDASGWENNTLSDFLGALAANATDPDGLYRNTDPGIDPEQATWRVFADASAGASVYG